MKIRYWINAARLRTLPLSLSGILVGNFFAFYHPDFSYITLALCVYLAICIQILSNFANDYGDGVKGTDNENRVGPKRMLQAGLLSKIDLKRGIIIITMKIAILTLILLWITLNNERLYFFLFLVLGILSVIAAITYTIGKKPYGYMGLGDISVFIFFGIISVLGSYFLHTKTLPLELILIASSIGFFSVGVLNLNNIRDVKNDKESQKNTLVVKFGAKVAKRYHFILLLLPFVLTSWYFYLTDIKILNYIYLILLIPVIKHLLFITKNNESKKIDSQLKVVVFITLLYSICMVITQLI